MRTSAAVQLRDLSCELVRQGHQLTILLPSHDLSSPWELDTFCGAQIVRLRAPRTKDVNHAHRAIGEWLMPYSMACNLKLSPVADDFWDGVLWYSPSIFHAPLVRILKRQSGCRSYLIIRDIFPDWAVDVGLMQPGLTHEFFRWIASNQYQAADIIGVQSPGNLSYFEAWKDQKHGRRLEVLQNWLSSPTNTQCSIHIDGTELAGRRILVYAGNMGLAQGIDTVIDLAERVHDRKDIGFLFVGRGSEVDRLRTRCKSLQLDNVLFHSEIDPDEIPQLYKQCAAGIVSLDCRHKSHNIPGKFLTYLQNGLPTLAIVNSGNDLASLIRNERVGVVCETNDMDELERLCTAMLDQIEVDESISDRCIQLFKRQFSVSRAAQQIVAALNDADDCIPSRTAL